MKTLNLFLKMHFTSLSPDGQPVSLAIVTEEYFNEEYQKYYTDKVEIKKGNCSIDHLTSKSFYAEFQDFDINRCDDWVKENVLSKISLSGGVIPKGYDHLIGFDGNNFSYTIFQDSKNRMPGDTKTIFGDNVGCVSDSKGIKAAITNWISQFSDYKLNFIVDCGWFTWYKFVELMGEWDEKDVDFDYSEFSPIQEIEIRQALRFKSGLPKLPANFPPVPIDLNDLILYKYGFKSVADAFNADRENLMYLIDDSKQNSGLYSVIDNVYTLNSNKFNALFDAKVTKAIYEKLK